ncbi:MAG: DNA polymerase III subunit [Acidimicrobiia bacterium]|nr:DNA polymerase III subunit [Acidimicrobiia bacterium]
MWERVVGQERAVGVLRRAAGQPVHSYLLVGPSGSGVEDAARCFAASLLAPQGGDGEPERSESGADRGVLRTVDLVLRGVHPDVVEFEPEGVSILAAQVVEIIREASRAPVEAERKVLIVLDCDRMNETAANKLLKTLEEPPERTHIVLVTGSPDDLLPTIRSRCQRIELEPVSDEVAREALVHAGASEPDAELAARLAGGHLARARRLVGHLAPLRDAFAGVPARIDGSGGTAHVVGADLDAAVDAAVASVEERHAGELKAFEEDLERLGYAGRDAQRLRRRLEERHKRESRRARMDALEEGVTAIETVYRDALAAPAPRLNTDREPVAVPAWAAAEALDACRDARRALAMNEKGMLHLQRLLLVLPPAGGGPLRAR